MRKISFALLGIALLPTLAATPVVAKSTGGTIAQALSAASRALDDDGSSEPVDVPEGMVSAVDPDGVAAALQALGYKAEMDVDGIGDPLIRSAAEGANYRIYFFGCSDNTNCDSLMFSAGFDLTDGMGVTAINDWNSDAVITRGYLDDEDDPYLEMYLLTGRGDGISTEVFEAAVGEWNQSLARFQDAIDW
ncbi:hypothetical protein PSM7751_00126 [Pseudooceanicola marinus]|uniref:YbjN domain-containing protein n=1 Tax=Pseudooceanicola marinus TaxID=396013 RepID=A0A1X6Y5L4_9RHOB|nr:YbjN domain-containing protein [Pseudooceanicola marinus]PJE33343.1 YbjN domain-containing protein [Pseudooceanicola marinus]SLN11101.1 hypothetical protein PSM7751_00126 [Pseudooceanicola marinus]